MTATLSDALSSHKKVELVAKVVRRMKVQEALDLLYFMPKKSAKILWKVVKSASANAVTNAGASLDSLYIDRIEVGKGQDLKRVRYGARSRVSSYNKFRSYVKVILATK